MNLDRALILIGGIVENACIREELLESEFDITPYFAIKLFDYERILDVAFQWFPLYDGFKLLDMHGDWAQFWFHSRIRKAIRSALAAQVRSLYKRGFKKIDCLAYSLGTWILAGTAVELDNVYMVGGPIHSRLWPVTRAVQEELKKNSRYPKINKLYYVYNKHDWLGTRELPVNIMRNLVKSDDSYIPLNIGKGHGFVQYMNVLALEVLKDVS